jgi:hypothetical protein
LERLGGIGLVALGSAVGLLLSLTGLLAAALVPSPWAFAVLAAATYVTEASASRRLAGALGMLARARLGVRPAPAFRAMAALVLLARLGEAGSATFVAVAIGLVVVQALRAGLAGLMLLVQWCRRLPAVTRNVDLTDLRIPDAPPRFLASPGSGLLALADVPLMVGVVVGAIRHQPGAGLVGMMVALAGVAALAGYLGLHAWRVRHLTAKGRVLRLVNDRLREYAPEVMVYFSGGLESAYQLNGWLPVLDRLDRRVVIILRERGMLPLIGPTSRPVVCLPLGKDLTSFRMPTARVALFVANAANNTHLLRMPGIRTVFIGHGDSDKQSSTNPFSKVYDEVWVAGPAGRDRYHQAGVGVADEDIVEVGRPRPRPVGDGSRPSGSLPTVLYAPTWEGIDDSAATTSLISMGPAIVRALLDRTPPVRLLYRPHPLTGTRDRRARAAHEEILGMIARANAARDAAEEWRPHAAASSKERAQAAAELARLDGELADLAGPVVARSAGDEAQLARDCGHVAELDGAGRDAAAATWHRAYWAAEGWWRHRVATGSRPTLHDCFDQADLLVADISGVVTDFLVTGKPYVVTNPDGLDEHRFRTGHTVTGAAYPLGPDCAELDRVLGYLDKADPDPLAERRNDLRSYLLGPDEPDALSRFKAALDDILARTADEDLTPPLQ